MAIVKYRKLRLYMGIGSAAIYPAWLIRLEAILTDIRGMITIQGKPYQPTSIKEQHKVLLH